VLTLLPTLVLFAAWIQSPPPAASASPPRVAASTATELADYTAAIHKKDVPARAKGIETFLQTYPESPLQERALEYLVNSYEQTDDSQWWKAVDRLLSRNPDNLYGLAQRTKVRCDMGPPDRPCEKEERDIVTRGLRVLASAAKPDFMSEEAFAQFKVQAALDFHHLGGMLALMSQDSLGAVQHFRGALEIGPDSLRDTYSLALAYLNGSPPDIKAGIFFLARSVVLASNSPARKQIETYAKATYIKFHGSESGWSDLLTLAKQHTVPPEGFTFAPASRLGGQNR